MTNIANDYDKNTNLNHVVMIFNGAEQIDKKMGTIEFDYYKGNDNQNINQATVVTLRYNMETKKVYEIEYEKGHGKRVSGTDLLIEKSISDYLIKDIFLALEKEEEYQKLLSSINPKLHFDYRVDDLEIYLYDADKDDKLVYKYKIEY